MFSSFSKSFTSIHRSAAANASHDHKAAATTTPTVMSHQSPHQSASSSSSSSGSSSTRQGGGGASPGGNNNNNYSNNNNNFGSGVGGIGSSSGVGMDPISEAAPHVDPFIPASLNSASTSLVGGAGGAAGGGGMTALGVTDNLASIALACDGGMDGGSLNQGRLTPEDFILLKVIGKGSYGKVLLVKYKGTGEIHAMKMLRKESIIKRNQVEHTRTERNVLESITHPFIVQLFYAFQTPKKLYFVMEYCPGGELFFHLSRAGRFTEARARFYASEIVLALEHLHHYDIVYRDLKPENILLDEEGHVRLTDFGLSKEGVQDNFSAKSLCGTPEYLAPEILNQTGHGKAVDWWSLGALIYEMLTGLPPFYTRDRERLFENIRCRDLRYPAFISPVARSLLVGLFQRDPSRRLGGGPRDADDIKCHPFFATVNWERVFAKKEVPPFRPTLSSKTDVQYFDKEFVRLPVNNSEAPDSALSQTAAAKDDMFPGFSYDRDAGAMHGGNAGGGDINMHE